jgi:hypothetical protein
LRKLRVSNCISQSIVSDWLTDIPTGLIYLDIETNNDLPASIFAPILQSNIETLCLRGTLLTDTEDTDASHFESFATNTSITDFSLEVDNPVSAKSVLALMRKMTDLVHVAMVLEFGDDLPAIFDDHTSPVLENIAAHVAKSKIRSFIPSYINHVTIRVDAKYVQAIDNSNVTLADLCTSNITQLKQSLPNQAGAIRPSPTTSKMYTLYKQDD